MNLSIYKRSQSFKRWKHLFRVLKPFRPLLPFTAFLIRKLLKKVLKLIIESLVSLLIQDILSRVLDALKSNLYLCGHLFDPAKHTALKKNQTGNIRNIDYLKKWLVYFYIFINNNLWLWFEYFVELVFFSFQF